MDKKQSDLKKRAFDGFDKLNLKPFAENLLQNIEKGTASSIGERGAYTISLNADFGNGKTTFLEMFKKFIEDEKSQDYNIISINAWESDFYGEPIISILSELVNYMRKNNGDSKGKKIIKIIGKVGINIGNQLIQSQTGVNIKDIKSSLEENGNKLWEAFNLRKGTIKEIKTAISEYTEGKKLLIIVDELDRARPDYAVHFLEDMKHFFNIENVIFLVAVNRKQMETTVKCLYGQDLNFNGYYGKFFKQEIDLPDIYTRAQRFVDNLIKKTNITYNQDDKNKIVKNFYFSCKIFNLSLREIENFTIMFNSILNEKLNLKYIDVTCYLFFSLLYFKEKYLFRKVLSGDFTVDILFKFLKDKNMEILIQEQKNIKLIPLLRITACSLMTKQSENRDRSIFQQKAQDEEILGDGYDYILSEMHAERRFGNNYTQFALEICNKIDKYK